MSGYELKKKIEEANNELSVLLNTNDYNLQKYEIIKCSQQLDVLIVTYMQAIAYEA